MTMTGWENFFIAEVGASATLAGLVFVGVSINLAKIVAYPGLPNRILEALIALLLVLLVSSLQLIPGQILLFSGSEVLLIGSSGWIAMFRLHIIHLRTVEREHLRQALVEATFGQTAVLSFVVAGILIITQGAGGMYWISLGTICAFLIVFYNAWILLIEINR
jgi:modulator of FtsH protease